MAAPRAPRRRGVTMTGPQVRALREAHGLTQAQVGELLSYTENYIALVEREDKPVTPRFEKLVRALLLKPTGNLGYVTPRRRPGRQRTDES